MGKSLIYSFFILLFGVFILDICNDEKVFSEIENRYLAKRPYLSKDNVLSGEYSKGYEDYINDNFINRDNFINLKSIIETLLLKTENNGVVYGNDGYLFDKKMNFDEIVLRENISAIKDFVSLNKNVNLMVVPYSYSILNDKYNERLKLIDEIAIINEINNYLKDNAINIINTLNENKNDYIYYKTDHHWTTYGAYLAYLQFCEKNELKKIDLNQYKKKDVEEFLGTFYSKSKKVNVEPDVLTYFKFNNLSMSVNDGEFQNIYKLENLDKRDKYSVFLDGNHSKVVIKNSLINSEKKLLVLKDSFANNLIPFLAMHFEEVHVIDLRHYNLKLGDYISNNDFNKILLLYSLDTLMKDKTIKKLNF